MSIKYKDGNGTIHSISESISTDMISSTMDNKITNTIENNNFNAVTSNAVYQKKNELESLINTKQDTIDVITVHAENWRTFTTVENRYADWVQANITTPTIPSGYIPLRFFAEVSEVENGHVDVYPVYTNSSGIPNCVGINTDGQVTTCKLRLGAVCIKL